MAELHPAVREEMRQKIKAIYLEAAPDRLLTAQEAARLLGITDQTLYKRRHQLPFRGWVVPTGTRLVRFSERAIHEYLDSMRGKPALTEAEA